MKKRKFADGGETIDYIETPSQKEAKERALALANDPEAAGVGRPKFNIDEFTAFQQEKPPRDPFAKIPLEPKAKPKVVTLEQLQAFKKQYGADKDLTDYMNAQRGLTRRGGSATVTPSANAYGKEQQYQRAQEAETSPAAKERRRAKEKEQALEASHPELDIAGGMANASLKTIAKLAKGLANRGGAKTAAKQLERVEPTLAKEAEQLALPAPTKRIGYDKAGAKAAERSARAESRNAEMLKENLNRYGMTERTSPDAINAVRKNLGMGRGYEVMKKGGAVKKYASGGAVSSRADGIAQRGKTRCKVC